MRPSRSYTRANAPAKARKPKGEVLDTVHQTQNHCYRLVRVNASCFCIERRRKFLNEFPCPVYAWCIDAEYPTLQEAMDKFRFITVYG